MRQMILSSGDRANDIKQQHRWSSELVRWDCKGFKRDPDQR